MAEQGNGSHPFTVFPEELWSLIFNKVDNSDDLTAVSKSNSDLAELLNQSKTTWLFDKVLPLIIPYLTTKQVLTCRQVCPRWNKLIHNFLKDHHPSLAPVKIPIQASDDLAVNLFEGLRVTTLSLPALLEDSKLQIPGRRLKIKLFPETEEDGILGNPTFFRAESERLTPETAHQFEQFEARLRAYRQLQSLTTDEVIPLLDRIGSQICYLTLEIYPHPQMMYRDAVIFLEACLSRVPNLKSLELNGWFFKLVRHLEPVRRLQSLQQEINFPPLPYLQCLLINVDNFPVAIEQMLYRSYGPQLSKLCMELSVLQSLQTANLTKLSIRHSRNPFEDDDLLIYWERLHCPNLRALSLDVDKVKLTTVVNIFQRCPQLEIMKLLTSLPISTKDLPVEFQAPRNLQQIQINDLALLNRRFLENVRSLKYIDFCEEPSIFGELMEEKKFINIDGGDIYKTYLWKVLPHLRRVVHIVEMEHTRRFMWNLRSKTYYDRETFRKLSIASST